MRSELIDFGTSNGQRVKAKRIGQRRIAAAERQNAMTGGRDL